MILIVLGHAGFPLKSYIYLFHVAVFFIIAGWCWKDCYSDGIRNVASFLKKRICSLYIPYVVWLSLFTLLHNFFLRIHFYTDDVSFLEGKTGNSFGLAYYYTGYDFFASIIKNLLFYGNEPMAGASWFIRCLFFLLVLWTCIDFLIKKFFTTKVHIARLIISLIFFGVGNILRIKGVFLPGNLSAVFSVYILFGFGIYHKMLMGKADNTLCEKRICKIFLILICIFLLGIMNAIGKIELSMNQYDNVLFLLAASVTGWILLLETASMIRSKKLKKMLSVIGKNTIWILFLHFFVFKFINALQVALYDLPLYRIASYPTLYTENGWWILYTIAGVSVPIYIKYLTQNLFKR